MGEVSLSPPVQAHRQRRKHSSGLLRCIWDGDERVPKKIYKAQLSSSVCTWKAAPGSSYQFSRPEPLSQHQLHTPEHASFAIMQVIILVNAIKLIQADLPFLWGELVHMVWEQVHSSDFGRVPKKKADLASIIVILEHLLMVSNSFCEVQYQAYQHNWLVFYCRHVTAGYLHLGEHDSEDDDYDGDTYITYMITLVPFIFKARHSFAWLGPPTQSCLSIL